VVMLIAIPMGFFRLDNNIIIQNCAFIMLLIVLLDWFVNFFISGLQTSRLPAFGSQMDEVLGTVIFNYAFVTTVPSWVNEKKGIVSINKSVWSATAISTVFYLSIGIFGALAFDFNSNDDLLSVINASTTGVNHYIAQVFVYLFPVAALLSSIPVYSIVIRYNLVENKICRKSFAQFWAVVFPWVLSVVFYTGAGLLVLINWASLLVTGFINFVIPMILFIVVMRSTFDGYSFEEDELKQENIKFGENELQMKEILLNEAENEINTENTCSTQSHMQAYFIEEEERREDFREIEEIFEDPTPSERMENSLDNSPKDNFSEFSSEFQVLPKWMNATIVALVLTGTITAVLIVVIGLNIASAVTGSQ